MNRGKRLAGALPPMHIWKGANGVRIAGDLWGPSDRPLVVLTHGGGQTRHAWKNTGVILAQAGYHVIALDARGHGDSGWAEDGDYSQNIMVEDLRCVLSEIGQPHPVLVGASMGGLTSLIAVGESQIDARALVLVDIAPKLERAGTQRVLDFMDLRPEGFDSLEEVADAINQYQPHRKRSKSLEGLAKSLRIDDRGKYRWHWDPQFRRRIVDPDEMELRLETCARNISVPTLLVRGDLSDVLSESGVRAFKELCPSAEYMNVRDTAHMIVGDRNDAFGTMAIEFLSRVVPPQ
ncbi:alpha/beta fold hydrolase [Bradyrhizobium sp. AZCC 2289]|uniref:alpha/beta fold hydrolase n=1 Tax=Bradyrhizobium sp. AZCC 2289 TaxID=3117026 RepID=UPI002FF0DD41